MIFFTSIRRYESSVTHFRDMNSVLSVSSRYEIGLLVTLVS
jgi:hypothetical protein